MPTTFSQWILSNKLLFIIIDGKNNFNDGFKLESLITYNRRFVVKIL